MVKVLVLTDKGTIAAVEIGSLGGLGASLAVDVDGVAQTPPLEINFGRGGRVSTSTSTNDLGHGELDIYYSAYAAQAYGDSIDSSRVVDEVTMDIVACWFAYRALASADYDGKVVLQAENEASGWVVIDTLQFGNSVVINSSLKDWFDDGSDTSKQLKFPLHLQFKVVTQCTVGSLGLKLAYIDNGDTGL